jgi:SAM-dependent methyltransferase
MARYVFRQDYQRERERLQLLERYSDGISQRALLDSVQLSGCHCAEVGAGAGSITRWLSIQAGSQGTVDAIDIDLRHIPADLPANVRVLEQDIDKAEIAGRYDAIHCRFLLLHLPDANSTLSKLYGALTNRGTLVAIDSDHSTWEIGPRYPFAQRTRAAYLAVARNAGWNLALGRDLPEMLEAAGFANVSAAGYVEYTRGGSDACRFLAASFRSLEAELLETGLLTRYDLEETITALNADLDFAMRYVTIWAVTGSHGEG